MLDRIVLSVMGPHAGESSNAIFARKMSDISTVGYTLWLCRSPAANPDRTRDFDAREIWFLEPSTQNGARPTTESAVACEFFDGRGWSALPERLSPVTGLLSRGAYAFKMSRIDLCTGRFVDLWQYASDGEPVRFRLGASTLLAAPKDTSKDEGRMQSRMRRVIAVGTLVEPYAVWVR